VTPLRASRDVTEQDTSPGCCATIADAPPIWKTRDAINQPRRQVGPVARCLRPCSDRAREFLARRAAAILLASVLVSGISSAQEQGRDSAHTSSQPVDSAWTAPIAAALIALPIDSLCRVRWRPGKHTRESCQVVVVDPVVYEAGVWDHQAEPKSFPLGSLPGSLLVQIGTGGRKFVVTNCCALFRDSPDWGRPTQRHGRLPDTLMVTVAIPHRELGDVPEAVIAFDITPPWIFPGWIADVWVHRDGPEWRPGAFRIWEE
jgi:hypothetical protein